MVPMSSVTRSCKGVEAVLCAVDAWFLMWFGSEVRSFRIRCTKIGGTSQGNEELFGTRLLRADMGRGV